MLVEDHPMVVEGLKGVIDNEPGLELCGIAGDAATCLELLKNQNPDVVLLDIMLPGMSGIELCARINSDWPGVKLVALTSYSQRFYVESMLENGAHGYLLKNADSSEIIQAIQSVCEGETYLCDEIVTLVERRSESSVSISKRESVVLQLIAEGLTNKEIAEKLFISPLTVDSHRKNLIIKLEARNTASLIKTAIEQGYIRT